MKKIDNKTGKLPKQDDHLPLSAAVRSKKDKILAEYNVWDKEFTRQQKGCENRCRKKYVGPLPFSPEMQGWIDRRDTLNWLKRYHVLRMSPNCWKGRKIKFKSLKCA